jgi:NAD(P)H-dependent glutamate synthase small subunit
MTRPNGFMEHSRKTMAKRPVGERTQDYREFENQMTPGDLASQSARCMDCGIPFCHACGCPLGNIIPEWSDLVYHRQWQRALDLLHATNNFPEITGRVCPAPCEAACTLGVNDEPVSIRNIELHVAEIAWKEGLVRPQPAEVKTGRRVAVVGSGPAGLAAAQQMARTGHSVVVYEAADRLGGWLRYGIPDFKLEKHIIDRRLDQLRAEGVVFETNARVGVDLSIAYLRRIFDAILLAGGARESRDMKVPGRELKGIYQATDYLIQQNRRVAGDVIPEADSVTATGKHVVIIGGGDTGSDCVGTAIRQGAADVLQLEILPCPPSRRDPSTPWPQWPLILRTSSSHEEGGERRWSVLAKEFIGMDGRVTALRCVEVDWCRDASTGAMSYTEKAGTEFLVPADLVLLAMGFTRRGNMMILRAFGIETTSEGQVVRDAAGMTSVPGVFVAGDLSHGASLVVRAIADARVAAASIDKYLRGLPKK